MSSIIIGTAGHVDHGKTALVKRLTGVDTDRLQEEKIRGVSIVPGFAPLRLKNGTTIGIVDVPGHERFIKNMLIGASGIDMVLLVIAADDGVMPQTKEHVDILKILNIQHGIVVITKTDIVDGDWLSLIREDILHYLPSTPFAEAPIVEISSVTGEGIDELLDLIESEVEKILSRRKASLTRLAVDRYFTMPGFGAVVTGTLWGGQIQTGDKLAIFPGKTEARVRGLQIHGESGDTATAGERVAVNLAGVDKEHIKRGCWIATPNLLKDTLRIDAEITLLPSSPSVKQGSRVHAHHGAMSVLTRIVLLDREELKAGESAYAQLALESPLCPLPGDRIVLRFYSPLITIGGATVIDVAPKKHKRFDEKLLSDLGQRASGGMTDTVLKTIGDSNRLWTRDEIEQLLASQGVDDTGVLFRGERLAQIGDNLFISSTQEEAARALLIKTLTAYYEKHPLRLGPSREALLSGTFKDFSRKDFLSLLKRWAEKGILTMNGMLVVLAGRTPSSTDKQKAYKASILSAVTTSGFSPVPITEIASANKIPTSELNELLIWMTESSEIIKLDEDLFIAVPALEKAKERIRSISEKERFSLNAARDALETSRKYTLLILDYLLKSNQTKRDGDFHIWL